MSPAAWVAVAAYITTAVTLVYLIITLGLASYTAYRNDGGPAGWIAGMLASFSVLLWIAAIGLDQYQSYF